MLKTLNVLSQQYAPLINAALTILLVSVTAWYAFVTRRMWREMVESRLSSIRPLIFIETGALEQKKPPDNELGLVMGGIKMHNFGRGPAYALELSVDVPYEHRNEKSRVETRLKQGIEAKLLPNESLAGTFSVYTDQTPLDKPVADFLRVSCRFRDAEGNYFSIQQAYSLSVTELHQKVYRHLLLSSEEVRFSLFSRYRRKRPHEFPLHGTMDLVAKQDDPVWKYTMPKGTG